MEGVRHLENWGTYNLVEVKSLILDGVRHLENWGTYNFNNVNKNKLTFS
jgi:hypothetical protein